MINKNLFVNTDAFDCVVTLERNGVKIRKVSLETHTEPLHEDTYALPFGPVDVPGEYAVTVSFRLKEGTIWAAAGHEVAFGQHVYKVTR